MKSSPLITLLSDFGARDGYVAAMKGVIYSQCPMARVVDAAHDIRRHDIRSAAWVLRQYGWTFPDGTLHVAVVDPGVGTERAALVIEAGDQLWLGPDNGLFAWILKQHPKARMWRIKSGVVRPGDASSTFHGRDLFAYAAGLLAKGVRLERLAEPVDSWFEPEWLTPVLHGRTLVGQVLHVDHFGNMITNLPAALVADRGADAVIQVGNLKLKGIMRTYADVPKGKALALIGSDGMMELAVNQGDASKSMRKTTGASVFVT